MTAIPYVYGTRYSQARRERGAPVQQGWATMNPDRDGSVAPLPTWALRSAGRKAEKGRPATPRNRSIPAAPDTRSAISPVFVQYFQPFFTTAKPLFSK